MPNVIFRFAVCGYRINSMNVIDLSIQIIIISISSYLIGVNPHLVR